MPFSLHLHIGRETPSKQRGDLLCFKMLVYIVLWINVLSNQSVIPRSVCFALLCSALDKLHLNFAVEGSGVHESASLKPEFHHILWNSLIGSKVKKCNLSQNILLFIKEIRLECLFLIILLGLQKTQTNWMHNTSQWCRLTGQRHVLYSGEWQML